MLKYVLICWVLCALACSGSAFTSGEGEEQPFLEADAGAHPTIDSSDAGEAVGGSAGSSAGGSATGGSAGGGAGGSSSGGDDIGGAGGVAGGGVSVGGSVGGVAGSAGAGGSAGVSSVSGCEDFSSDRSGWTVWAMPDGAANPSTYAIDDDIETRWMTLEPTKGDEIFRVGFGRELPMTGVVIRTIFESGEGYTIMTSSTRMSNEVLAYGDGPTPADGVFRVEWNGLVIRGSELRIFQTGSSPGSFWSIYDITPICE